MKHKQFISISKLEKDVFAVTEIDDTLSGIHRAASQLVYDMNKNIDNAILKETSTELLVGIFKKVSMELDNRGYSDDKSWR